MNKDGNRNLPCCLWAEWLWRQRDTCAELGLREDKGRKIGERKGKGRKRKKERWGVERTNWREKCKDRESISCSGRRIVSWEGTASPPQVSWPLWPKSRPSSGCLCPHPVTLYHAQEHCLLCDLQLHLPLILLHPGRDIPILIQVQGEEQGNKGRFYYELWEPQDRTHQSPFSSLLPAPVYEVGPIKPELM